MPAITGFLWPELATPGFRHETGLLRLPDPAPDQCRARLGPVALLRAEAVREAYYEAQPSGREAVEANEQQQVPVVSRVACTTRGDSISYDSPHF